MIRIVWRWIVWWLVIFLIRCIFNRCFTGSLKGVWSVAMRTQRWILLNVNTPILVYWHFFPMHSCLGWFVSFRFLCFNCRFWIRIKMCIKSYGYNRWNLNVSFLVCNKIKFVWAFYYKMFSNCNKLLFFSSPKTYNSIDIELFLKIFE